MNRFSHPLVLLHNTLCHYYDTCYSVLLCGIKEWKFPLATSLWHLISIVRAPLIEVTSKGREPAALITAHSH
jgi:hypothetical protein